MKKSLSILAASLALLMAVSCGQRQNSTNNKQASEKSPAELRAERLIKTHLDSIANELTKVNPIGIVGDIKDGKVVLTKKEKVLKPDYLAGSAFTNNLQTLSQKYRAIAVLSVDKEIAKLYEMSVTAYDEALTKLYADVNDPALKVFSEGLELKDAVDSFYKASKDNGRMHLFWDAMTAAIVEQMYIASKNSDKFLAAFTDETAGNFTWYVYLLTIAIEDLATVNPSYTELNNSVKPLTKINALTVAEFKEQLKSASADIEVARKALTLD